jgi:hypothetical protein
MRLFQGGDGGVKVELITPKSDAVGRCSMNSDKAMNLDKK